MSNQIQNENQVFTLEKIPIIKRYFAIVGARVNKRIAELDIDKQVVTDETIQAMKSSRAELNKESALGKQKLNEFLDYFERPIDSVRADFKALVIDPYTKADALYKTKITDNEIIRKTAKKVEVETYFAELCIAEKIDFVTFEKVGLEINLSTTAKKYKEQCFDFIAKIVDDVNLIKASNFEAETMVEYKKTLNASKAITTIKERKEGEEKEDARIKAERNKKRQNECISLGMVWVSIVNSFDFDANISISKEQLETLSVEDFTTLIAETKVKIDATKVVEAAKPTITQASTATEIMNTIFDTPKTEPATPIQAPTVTETPKQMTAKFEVSGSKEQLLALGQYMKSNSINYKNI